MDDISPEPVKPKAKKRWITGFGIGLIVVLVFAITAFSGFKMVQVSGESMTPLYKDGQKVLMTNWYWLVGPVRHDDIVVIKGSTPGEFLFKRAQYLSGETVDWVNVPRTWTMASGRYKVPEGYIFVIGDNLAASSDSRDFGPVPVEDIVGKVIP